ncbi:hypothetical protein [Paenibacillus rigui]|uniref:hypothetical protein n=1 Tax=Paenibacillus rigui TaxID=554312 RepID=UPI0015C5C468|nr:hypothetical protein [Paenibacillus rigui]
MMKCPRCYKLIEIHQKECAYCGAVIKHTIAQKFDMLAESVENALKRELEARRRRH